MNSNLKLEFEDNNGKKIFVNVIAKFDDGNDDYVITEDCEDNSKKYIFKIETVGNEETLISIDDEKELERLSLIANKIVLEELK